jgi:hypothetical protein
VYVKIKAFLQGPYNTGTGLMNTTLKSSGILASHFDLIPIPASAVDSINIEIRDAASAALSTVRAFAPAWLMSDGNIRMFSDTTKAYVELTALTGNYYVVVHHRNHLAVMSAAKVVFAFDSAKYDFTTAQTQAYNPSASPMKDLDGVNFGMWCGDVNGNGVIKYNGSQNDRSIILTLLGGTDISATLNGYYNEDINLNGQVKYNGSQNDRSIILTNLGGVDISSTKSTTVP